MEVSPSHVRARRVSTRLASALVVGAAVGTLEWLCATHWPSDIATALRGWLTLVGVWGVFSGAYVFVESGILWMAFGMTGSDQAGQAVSSWARDAWRQRHAVEQPARVARLCAFVLAAGCWLAGSAALIAHLIVHRHGPWLIALAALAGQAVWSLPCALLGRSLMRGMHWLLKRRSPRWLHVPSVLLSLTLGSLVLVSTLAVRFWDIVLQTDAPAVAWPWLMLAGSWLLIHRWDPARVARHRTAWLVWLACLLSLPFSLGSGGARAFALRDAHTSKYMLKGLMNLSDVDGDGAATFPIWTDCAPFDARRHPAAMERPGNGIDENCDGLDELSLFESNAHADFELPRGPRPNLVLVTMDATRADHLGFMGYERDTSPHLDALAKHSVVFTRAFSQDSGTGPSFWSMHTGKTPFQVKLADPVPFPPRLAPSERTLAQHLQQAGYHTVAVLCGSLFDSPGFDVRRGFSHFENVCRGKHTELAKHTADAALRTLQNARAPFFLWVHFFDPHEPYQPAKLDFGRDPIARYDAEIRYTDAHIGRLLDALDAGPQGAQTPTYVAITADHGENFGEHGPDPHARNLYRVVTHVPLLLHGPGLSPGRIDVPVAANDLFPTLLQLARLPESPASTMQSQVPVAFGEPPDPTRVVFQENSYSRPRRDTKGAVRGDYHFILDLTTGVEELYNYVDDPAERHNLIGTGLPEEGHLRQALLQFVSTTHVPRELNR